MTPRSFDRFMVDLEIGGNAKVGRLSDREFRCLVSGVWPLAGKSPRRGYLIIAGSPATAEDVARQAHCSTAIARSTLERMRQWELLDKPDKDGFEYVHDWHEMNPDPRPSDTPEARRVRKQRQRQNGDGHSDVTRDTPVTSRAMSRKSHDPEVKGEVEDRSGLRPSLADGSAASDQDSDRRVEDQIAFLCALMSVEVRATHGIAERSKTALPGKTWHNACRRMLTRDGYTAEQIEYAIRWVCKHHVWRWKVRSMTRLCSEMEQVVAEIKAQRRGGTVVPIGRRENASDLLRRLGRDDDTTIEGTAS